MDEARDIRVEERSVAARADRELSPAVKRYGIHLIVALVIFLQRELQLSRMQNMLASSAVDAQRGEYETARQQASDFFTALREQLDRGETNATLTAPQRDGLKPLLTLL